MPRSQNQTTAHLRPRVSRGDGSFATVRAMSEVSAFSTYGLSAGSPRVRVADWFDHLGIPHRWHNYADTPNVFPLTMAKNLGRMASAERELRTSYPSGTVIISREATPWGWGGVEERLLANASRGIFDFDDAIFDDPSWLRRPLRPAAKFERCLRAADIVIAGNEYLADRASEGARDVRVIPSCVEPSAYTMKSSWDVGERPIFVWLGSPATEHFVVSIARPLLEVHRRTGARLKLISGPRHNELLEPLAPMLDRVPWHLNRVQHDLLSADVAIGPLDDSLYARGKCAYKLLQYGATGLPMVASPVGANAKAISLLDGLAASSSGEWFEAMMSILTESGTRRAQRGRQGRKGVADHYSFARWEREWSAAVS